MTHPRAVLFDLDGTLLDTLDDIADSMNATLEQMGAPVHPASSYARFIGEGVELLVQRALPSDMALDEVLRRGVVQMRSHYARRWDNKTRPYAGIPELLDELARRGLTLAILSNKPHDFTRRIVEKLLARWRFEPTLGSREGVPKKPDPTVALEIARQHGIAPAAWLYLGDTPTDMKTAVAAGMLPVGVLWGFRGADELTGSGARHLIARPDSLLDLL